MVFLAQRRIHHDTVHVHPTPIVAVTTHPLILFSIRDPIKRFVSSFNAWREKTSSDKENNESSSPKLLRCVKTANELVHGAFLPPAPAAPDCVSDARGSSLKS